MAARARGVSAGPPSGARPHAEHGRSASARRTRAERVRTQEHGRSASAQWCEGSTCRPPARASAVCSLL
eukprot:6890616-Prymnesium_polylepis.1